MPASWKPIEANSLKSGIGRWCLAWPSYPAVLPYALFNWSETTVANARFHRTYFAVTGTVFGILGHMFIQRRSLGTRPLLRGLAHLGYFLAWDHTYLWLTFIAHQLISVIGLNRNTSRLAAGKLHGPRICVVGNGPSALEGKQNGDVIDTFDEVVRFNNFQTKAGDFNKWVGSKCTVHFSDGVLYPTFANYAAPGATVILSLFADRFMIAGTYFIQRGAQDLETALTINFLNDPEVNWMDKEFIESLKKKLGLETIKHPTSGMLAIEYFVEMPGVQLPVVITGFDFFQGPTIHYYDSYEPLWERINNYIGVNQHSPLKEKVYVEKLVAEGKVVFLKDVANEY